VVENRLKGSLPKLPKLPETFSKHKTLSESLSFQYLFLPLEYLGTFK